jgi:hypothetical protein
LFRQRHTDGQAELLVHLQKALATLSNDRP